MGAGDATKQPPRVTAQGSRRALVAASQLLSPKADPVAPTGPSVPAAPVAQGAGPDARSSCGRPAPAAHDAAGFAAAGAVVAPPGTVPAAQPVTSAADGRNLCEVTNKLSEDDAVQPPEVIPLPPRRPHLAAVPIPRPRPQIPEEQQARAEPQTLVDF